MFKNDFQGTPHFEIFSSNGTLAQNWKFVNKTFIGKTYDSQVKGYCYSCDKIGRLSLPKERSSIYLIQPFLNFQVYIPLGANFSLELSMSDLSGGRRRFFLSTAQYETKINALHVNLPLPGLLRGKWVNIVFDLASLMNENFRNQVFRSLNGLTLSGTFKLRKIFTLKYRPPDTSGVDMMDYDYANRHIEAIPRAVSFPIGVENIAQIFNMNRILIPVPKSSNQLLEIPKNTTKLVKLEKINKNVGYQATLGNKMNGASREKIGGYSRLSNIKTKIGENNGKNNTSNDLVNPKIVEKLPPIVSPLTRNENTKEYQTINDQMDEANMVLKVSSIELMEPKPYDPNLYSSEQETIQPDISTSDQLQNEINEFFENHVTENDVKDTTNQNSVTDASTIIIVSPQSNTSHTSLPDISCQKEHDDNFKVVNKPVYVSSAAGQSPMKPNSVLGSPLKESFNHSYSDDELELVANSLNNLLSDLKHDSEATLYPTKDPDDDLKYNAKIRTDDSVYYSSDEESDGNMELIFDPLGSSFTDPRTGKQYTLDN